MAGGVSIGPRIQVDGEEQYRQQILNIIEQSKTLDAEMKALTASFDDEDTAQQRAAKSTDLLNMQLEAARERTRLVREMTQKAAETTEENSTQTLKWRQALASAEEQQAKLERAVEENNKALLDQGEASKDAGKQMTGLGDTINSVAEKLGIRLPESAKNALNGFEGLSAGTVAKMAAVTAAVAAAVKVTKELHEITLQAAEQADTLLTRSAQTGLSTDLLQSLDYAQRFADFENLDQTLVKVTASMDAARDGAEKQAAAFDTLGVSVTNADGTLKDNWETFLQTIDALGEVKNATERDTLANDLFGKSYAQMKPLIDAGTGALQKYMDQAKETGKVLTNDQIRVLGEVDDAHQELTATIEAEKNMLAAQYAPAAKASMETFAKATKTAGDALTDSGLITNLASVVTSVTSIIDSGTDLVAALPDWLNPIRNVSMELKGLAVIAATVADSMTVLSGLLTLDFNKVKTGLGLNLRNGEMSNLERLKYSDPKYVSYNAAGTDFWRGGPTWVGESGPELVWLPQGTQIYSNQESRQIAAAGTDTRTLEGLLSEAVGLLEEIRAENQAAGMRKRMA